MKYIFLLIVLIPTLVFAVSEPEKIIIKNDLIRYEQERFWKYQDISKKLKRTSSTIQMKYSSGRKK